MRLIKQQKQALKRKERFFVSIIAVASLLTGCSYTAPTNQFGEDVAVMSISLIRGDEDGYLRDDLARQLSRSPGYAYSSSSGPYRIDVKIDKDSAEKIGYAWDEEPLTGAFIQRLYPNEGRRIVKATVSVTDTQQNKVVIEPFVVTASAEFDFVNPTALKNIEFRDMDGQEHSVLQYSLGQLDSEEGAKAESFQPLASELSKQIMQALKRAPVKR